MYSGSIRDSTSVSTRFTLKKYYLKSKEMLLYTRKP